MRRNWERHAQAGSHGDWLRRRSAASSAVRSFLRFSLGPERVPRDRSPPAGHSGLPDAPRAGEVDELFASLEGAEPLALRNRALDAGLDVTVLPGPSVVETALVASGLGMGAYRFLGYLPRSKAALDELWRELGRGRPGRDRPEPAEPGVALIVRR